MARRRSPADDDYEDDDDDDDDRDAPDPSDWDDDDDGDADTINCPRCGREVSELAEQCPQCGAYLSAEEATRTNFPTWVIVTAVLLLAGFALGWLGGVF